MRAIPRRNSFGRIAAACIASLVLYVTAFGLVLDHPLSLGFLRQQIDVKVALGAAVGGPKLVVLAGSNGPYSHRCTVIARLLHMPCINGGVAVGIGLDYLFARWERVLHPGDIVYLPMEEAQYVRGRVETDVGPDAAIMLRHDWRTLARLAPDRWAGAIFSTDLRDALMAPIEMALVAGDFHDPREAVTGGTDAWGDHTGHTAAMAVANAAELAAAQPYHPDAAKIGAGYGSTLIAAFLDWARAHDVRAIGGLPTGFADSPPSDASIDAIRVVYLSHGADFLELPNRSLYPRVAFFDTPSHLNETWQRIHSVAVADGLVALLRRTVSLREPPLSLRVGHRPAAADPP
ncbi:MAG TPA: hypothetical protein VGG99_17955 [Acetobacteraceae bacterium]